MYDAIMAQPHTSSQIVTNSRNLAVNIAQNLYNKQRIFLIGIGTSSHAAQVGQFLFREAGVEAQFVPAFDFALYGPDLTPNDAVILISHRGGKVYGIESIKRARAAGSYTVLITGEGEPPAMQYASATLKTVPQDRSSAHTISYCGAQVTLAILAEALYSVRTGTELRSATFLAQELSQHLEQALSVEEQIKALAGKHAQHRRIWLVGGGPSGITATEIALKIKETSYLQAEGMPVEMMMHGPFQCVEPEDLFVLIAPAGPAQKRTSEFSAEIRALGGAYLLVEDGSVDPESSFYQGAASVISVSQVPEVFTTLTCLLPLQLFTYYLALEHDTNPDGFRLQDPRFAAAYQQIKL
jgi:glucosamine--fructose-6-phosphate aminotransferase (isomerizing)